MAHDDVGALFDAYAVPVHRYLYRRLTNVDDPVSAAEDLTSDVFVIAWSKRDAIPQEAELPWLYGVARRVLANYRRKAQDVLALDGEAEDVIDHDDPAELVTEDMALRDAWRSLAARDREVLRLVAWEGLSGGQLATALGISPGGAAAALFRARERLAEALTVSSS